METSGLDALGTAAAAVGVLVVALTLLFRWRVRTFNFFQGTGIAGPRPSLISGNYHQLWNEKTIEGMDDCFKKYGDVYGIFNGDAPFVMVKDVELLKRVFVSDFGEFTDRGTVWRLMNEKPSNRNALSVAKGERWKPLRRCMSQAFTANKLKMLVPGMVETVDHFLELLEKQSSLGNEVDVRPYLSSVAFDLVAKTAFGMLPNAQDNPRNPFFVHATSVIPGLFGGLFHTCAQFFSGIKGCVPLMLTLDRWLGHDAFVSLSICSRPLVEIRRRNPELARPDLLQCLVEMEFDSDKVDIHGFSWTKKEREECKGNKTFFMPVNDVAANTANMLQAGFDTVSVTLQHCLFCLAKYQSVQDKIRSETKSVLEKHGQFTYDAVADLQYTAQTILETLRMYTPVVAFTSRLASRDYRYGDLLVPKGATVMACSHQVHHDPRLWEKPEEFDPDRFSPEQKASRDPLAFQAYGMGPRNCVGMKLAQLEMTLIVAKLLQNFKLHLGTKHQNGELKRRTFSVFAVPAEGVWIRFEKLRESS